MAHKWRNTWLIKDEIKAHKGRNIGLIKEKGGIYGS